MIKPTEDILVDRLGAELIGFIAIGKPIHQSGLVAALKTSPCALPLK